MNQEPNSPTYCYVHPKREATLRCNRCDRPICNECAVLTPTGYRCKECVRSQQKTFDTARSSDFPVAFAVAAVLSFIGSIVAVFMGFFTIFIAPIAGVITAEAVRMFIQRRRSKPLFQLAAAGAITGSLLIPLIIGLRYLGIFIPMPFYVPIGGLFALLWPVVYTFLVSSTIYYRLSGIQIR